MNVQIPNVVAAVPLGQPLYRPFMIVSLVLLALIAAVLWFLWKHRAVDELSLIDMFREVIRALVIVELVAGFVILTLEGKIAAEIFANSVGIIIAFLFGQRTGEKPKNGGTA